MNALQALISPSSIAIIGASDDPNRIGGRPVKYLRTYGFTGPLYLVNPTRKTVQGLTAYPDIASIGQPVDCALIALPAPAVVQAVRDCARLGVRSVVVFSAGFSELGDAGVAAQQQLTDIAVATGMRILGPNCLGMFNVHANAYLSFTNVLGDARPTGGGMAMVSQSGGYGSATMKLALDRGLTFGIWMTTGNECDVDVAELMLAMAERADVTAIVAYVEGVKSGAAFLRALEAARRNRKPVVLMKVGRTPEGAGAVASHTASIAGEDWVYDAVLRQYGVYRAHTTEELVDIALALSRGKFPAGPRVAVVTTSGGVGVQIADFASDFGLQLPKVPAHTQARLRVLSPNAATANPVDVTGQVVADPALLANCLELLLEDDAFDAVVIFLGLVASSASMSDKLLQTMADVRRKYPGPLLMVSVIGPRETTLRYEEAGYAVFEDPYRGIRSLGALLRFGLAMTAERQDAVIHSSVEGNREIIPAGRRFNEVEAKGILARCGVPVPVETMVLSPLEGARVAYPAAVKLVSAEILHKTDIGGVMLNLADAGAVALAIARIAANAKSHAPNATIDGFLVSPMVSGGVECLLGIHGDPVFGPVVVFGLGGVAVEIFKDVVCRLAPVSVAEAGAMVRAIKSFALLDGHRGKPKADLDALTRVIAAVSELAVANADRIRTLEINPLVVLPLGEGVLALDAVLETTTIPTARN